jgi:hypothetical protein
MDKLIDFFKLQLERIASSLKAPPAHASGNKKPSLAQQEKE